METSEDRRARVDPEINRPLNSLDVTPLRKSRTPLETFKKVGIPIIAAVLSLATIVVVAILIKVILDNYFFICGQPLLFIPREQVCDGHQDCALGEDEQYCVKKLPDGPPVAVRLSRDRSTLQVLNPATKNWASACFDSFTQALAKTACRQMGYDSKPTFRAVDVGLDQDLDIVKITENLQELQVQNSSGKHLDVPNWKVRAGSDRLGSSPSLPVAKIFILEPNATHPREHDIALVKLQLPLTFSGTIRPICLPFSDEELTPGTPLWVIGWGFTEENGGKMSDILQQGSVQVINSTRCNAEDAYQGEVTDTMMCAGLPEGGVDTCQGDSGGPLMYHSDRWQVVGIVSWGHGCGGPTTPGVYTKVTAYLSWIYNVRKSQNQMAATQKTSRSV
ncbi:hypothetical protein MJG53_010329 [Ovis ammon polii x Ovis aries]|uniref:Uncharacterized protein n=1 Tax=Ovis ammon polii x Ovis aries TaxID=2918886 RepID=A0ACB9UT86_9CETA|nr:hypothetical protein MJG53_010329 [Ovis ammon polii x Ovis aries]